MLVWHPGPTAPAGRSYRWFWLAWKQAMSYCDTACAFAPFEMVGLSALPAYCGPEVPAGLKGEPVAETEFPGVAIAFGDPQVVPGAPG